MSKKPYFHNCSGYTLGNIFDPEAIKEALDYKPEKGQTIVCTYPKCGTTWALQIILMIYRKGVPYETWQDYFQSLIYIDLVGTKALESMLKPGVVKTHFPFNDINYSPDAKYVHVARHPADCAVAFYHHVKYFHSYRFTDGTFDDFFDAFIDGEVDYNDYFDHLLSWYEKRHLPNVFFTTFEALKEDHRGMVLQIARFLGEEYYRSLNDDGAFLDNVCRYSSFEYMRVEVNRLHHEMLDFIQAQDPPGYAARSLIEATQEGHVSIGEFVRKGEVGEGKKMLSEAQWKKLNQVIIEKTAHSDVMDLWKNY